MTQELTQTLNGKQVSDSIIGELKQEVASMSTHYQRPPGLAVILVGDNPASEAYVGRKIKACKEIGIQSFDILLPQDTPESKLVKTIQDLNANSKVDGILLQLPLPKGIDEQKLLKLIDPDKDVDGFHPMNVGKLLLGLPTFISCTPYGVCELLKYYKVSTEGKHVVIVGRSNIVGKPLAALLVQKNPHANATVTICHSRSENLEAITSQADILIAAIGIANFIKPNMVKENAVVIDVGINRIDASNEKGYRLVGDVDYDNVSKKCSFITPVPGGVGPMTIAMLMKNTVISFKRRH